MPNEHDTRCNTRKGRESCLTAVRMVADRFAGATVELHEFNGPREIGLELAYGPYACMMHFEGGSRVGAYLGHWHMNRGTDADPNKTYPDSFWRIGSPNLYHRRKATTSCDTLAAFAAKLAEGLELLQALEPATTTRYKV